MRRLSRDEATPVTALLDVRVLPWRLRPRVMRPDAFREGVSELADPLNGVGFEDVGVFVFGLVVWLALIIAAPLVVLILAALLFSVELPIVIVIALVLVLVRFFGVVPWTVVTIDNVNRTESYESYRNLFTALRRIRDINGDRRVHVRWAVSGVSPRSSLPL